MEDKNFINIEKKYLSNFKDLIKNNKIKEAIKVLNEVEKKGFSEEFINSLIYLFLDSKIKNQGNVGSFFDGFCLQAKTWGATNKHETQRSLTFWVIGSAGSYTVGSLGSMGPFGQVTESPLRKLW